MALTQRTVACEPTGDDSACLVGSNAVTLIT